MDPLPTQPPSPDQPPHEAGLTNAQPAHTAGEVFAPSIGVAPAPALAPTPEPTPEPAINTDPIVIPAIIADPAAPDPIASSQPILGTENYTVGSSVVGDNNAGVIHSPTPHQKRRFSLKSPLVLVILVVLVLLGGSAAAYFGYYVPNKPENVLSKAVSNSLAQPQITTTGTVDSTSGGVAAHVEYTAATNETSHDVDLKLNATVSGVKIPLEVLIVNKNLYFKVGDLSSLEGLLSQFAGAGNAQYKSLEDQINKTITNQWIEVDSTLIKEAKLDCLASYPTAFSQTDIQSLQTAYKSSPFIAITSHSPDTLNGVAATKYQLSINDDALAKLNLSGTGYFKNLNDCLKKTSPTSSLNLTSLKDGDKTPITIWVSKSNKLIIKYATESTAKDKAKGVEASLSGTITYGAVNITQPANAKPVLNLLNDLNLNGLFTGEPSSPSSPGSGLPTILN